MLDCPFIMLQACSYELGTQSNMILNMDQPIKWAIFLRPFFLVVVLKYTLGKTCMMIEGSSNCLAALQHAEMVWSCRSDKNIDDVRERERERVIGLAQYRNNFPCVLSMVYFRCKSLENVKVKACELWNLQE